eukprot:6185243-Pleurochrysis_carterae.AAC.9
MAFAWRCFRMTCARVPTAAVALKAVGAHADVRRSRACACDQVFTLAPACLHVRLRLRRQSRAPFNKKLYARARVYSWPVRKHDGARARTGEEGRKKDERASGEP